MRQSYQLVRLFFFVFIIALSASLAPRVASADAKKIEAFLSLTASIGGLIAESNSSFDALNSAIEDGASDSEIERLSKGASAAVSAASSAIEAYVAFVTKTEFAVLINNAEEFRNSLNVADVADHPLGEAIVQMQNAKMSQYLADAESLKRFASNMQSISRRLDQVGATADVAFAAFDIYQAYEEISSDGQYLDVVGSSFEATGSTLTSILSIAATFAPNSALGAASGTFAAPLAVVSVGMKLSTSSFENAVDGTDELLVRQLARLNDAITAATLDLSQATAEIYRSGGSLTENELDELIDTRFASVLELLENTENPNWVTSINEFIARRGAVRNTNTERARTMLRYLLDDGALKERLSREIVVLERTRNFAIVIQSDLIDVLNEVDTLIVEISEIDIETGEVVIRESRESNLCGGRDCRNIWDIDLGGDTEGDSNRINSPEDDNTGIFVPIAGDNDASDRNDDVKIDIANDTLPDEAEPIGPTPEEIAESERLAELERQRLAKLQEIARLEDERTTQFEVKLAREVQIQNIDNELALLEFSDREEVQNVLSVVTGEEQRLRAELNDTGLSDEDQQRLQDLMVYQETLEGELDRISGRISSLKNERIQLQANLDSANTVIVANSNQLNALDYDYSQFTEPTTSEVLVDWSNYDYELPPFNETDAPTGDFTNVVVSTVSLPVTSGNIQTSGALISEDGSSIRYNVWGVDEARSEKLDDFEHLYYGTGTDGLQWIYGVATTPEQFALRAGTATFNGGLSGYYAHGTFDVNTVYEDSVMGELALNIDFGSNRLTGEGRVEIDTPVRSETLSFSLDEAAITQAGGLTRSLGFSSGATLGNDAGANGNFSGTFYGADASEAAGSFAFGLSGGFAAGVWAAGENFDPNQNDGPVGRFSTQKLSGAIFDAEYLSGEDTDPTFTDVPVSQGAGGGEIRLVNKFNSGDPADPYQYTSWGNWVANDNTIENYSEGGYFVEAEMRTPSSVIENKTGTASYSGDIVGDYVSGGVREDAVGQINLTANFATDTMQGQMQFGHGGAGTNAGGTVSPVADLVDVPISNNGTFEQNAGSFGVSGFFTGPDAEEVGGTAWMNVNDGSYNGVFRAKQ